MDRVSDVPVLPAGTAVTILGAFGPVVADGTPQTTPDGFATFGTPWADALSVNGAIVDPDTFSASDSADQSATIVGYGGDDFIQGTVEADILTGGAGNDTIYTYTTTDDIDGFDGETVLAGDENDIVYTGRSTPGAAARPKTHRSTAARARTPSNSIIPRAFTANGSATGCRSRSARTVTGPTRSESSGLSRPIRA